jgi:predicted phosphodiesterase
LIKKVDMRLAVISDIHGNMEALTAVLADIAPSEVDEIISLGDNIGYGPEPSEVIRCLKNLKIPSVIGNHELAVRDPARVFFFNPDAKISIQKTITLLPDDAKGFISSMPLVLRKFAYRFVHGFPPDSATVYLFSVMTNGLRASFSDFGESICFVGHTHYLELIDFDGCHVNRTKLGEGIINLDKERRYIINIGSVGQPRDGNNTAKYAILDTSSFTLDIRFVPYDIAGTVAKLLSDGWPEIHASRLW